MREGGGEGGNEVRGERAGGNPSYTLYHINKPVMTHAGFSGCKIRGILFLGMFGKQHANKRQFRFYVIA